VTTREGSTGRFDGLEADLRRAYAAKPPSGLEAKLGAFAGSAVAATVARSAPVRRPPLRIVRRSALVLIPVLLVVMASSVAGSRGLTGFFDEEGGYAWQHSERLGLSKTVNGYQFTLLRAYADVNQLVLDMSVRDLESRGWTGLSVPVEVTDSAGGTWQEVGGEGEGEPNTYDHILQFQPESAPATAGNLTFTVKVGSIVAPNPSAGPTGDALWHVLDIDTTFEFDLPVHSGWIASPGVTVRRDGVPATVGGLPAAPRDGVSVTLDRVVASPSQVRLEMHLAGVQATGFSPLLEVEHGATVLTGVMATVPMGSLAVTVWTSAGVEDGSGPWSVTISELVGDSYAPRNEPDSDPGPQVRLAGPWVLQFTMP
jgi:hypothetical protein